VLFSLVDPAAPAGTAPPTPALTGAPTNIPALLGTGDKTPVMASAQLVFVDSPATRHAACVSCLQEGRDLVSIHNTDENKANALAARPENRAWIGGNYFAREVCTTDVIGFSTAVGG